MDTLITLVFIVSTIVFFIGALQNYFLYRMYYNAYENIKKSKIIEILTKLFFWKTFVFIVLVFVAFSNTIQNKSVSLILRAIGLVPFIFVIYYLNQFSIWSTKSDEDSFWRKKEKNNNG